MAFQKKTQSLAEQLVALDAAVGAVKTRKAKVAALHKASNPSFKAVFGLAFDPNVKFLLPEGKPPYKTSADGIDAELIFTAVINRGKLAPFIAGNGYDNLKPLKREQLFLSMLSEIHPTDAELLCSLKEKKLPYPNLTKDLIKEAFPNLAGHW